MASLRQFHVLFDKPSATYEPGETVSGKIIIDTVKKEYVKGLYFIVKGGAFAYFLRDDPMLSKSTLYVMKSEDYFVLKHDILNISEGELEREIPKGRTEYPFIFTLPHNIPCSFEFECGYIRYTMNVVMERPFTFVHKCRTAFSVISCLDLNSYPERCIGIHDEMDKNFGFMCWMGGASLKLQIVMPCTGFVPGQIIAARIEYWSTSNIPIRKMSTKLVRTIRCITEGKTLPHKAVLEKTRHMQLCPNQRVTLKILTPPIAPSELEYCKIMDIHYKLVVSIHVSRPYSKIKRSYPILIGTVPLYRPASTVPRRVAFSFPTPSTSQLAITSTPIWKQGESSASNIRQEEQANTSSAYLDIPPPSYEESSFKTSNIRDDKETEFIFGADSPFSPKYPVFNYPAPSKIMNSLRNNLSGFNRIVNFRLNFLSSRVTR
ncbi:arrestin domain-containing protein 17-like [Bombus pyrosoma]|uniref:arrestin domain-containing protein 17-like n=1 Tax=Bombus pyrosoma TaxID=396416 RepID=UPI001CB9B5F5|nr:arrestin domain-containing protein 17-like [Bombus pyrosoma]